MELLDFARRKTTQKVNLYEKVQIPGYEDAIRKIKRFMEDEENLSKSAQKIVKTKQQAAGGGRDVMIARMSKYDFVLYAAQREDFIGKLRDLGLVDITTTGWEPLGGGPSVAARHRGMHEGCGVFEGVPRRRRALRRRCCGVRLGRGGL